MRTLRLAVMTVIIQSLHVLQRFIEIISELSSSTPISGGFVTGMV